jgi:hypothetical protein
MIRVEKWIILTGSSTPGILVEQRMETDPGFEAEASFILRFEVFMALRIHVVAFWIMTPCSRVGHYHNFDGVYCCAYVATIRDGVWIVNWIYWVSIQIHSITVYTLHNRLAAESLWRPIRLAITLMASLAITKLLSLGLLGQKICGSWK